jgi:hypothetical protein
MDDLETKRAEARAQGYTDEQIDAYLNPQSVERQDQPKQEGPGMFRTPAVGGGGTPAGPVSPFGSHGEENKAMAQYVAGKALEYGTELYTGKKLVLDPLLRALGNRGAAPAPTPAPTTFTGGANPAFDRALSQAPQTTQPGIIQRGMDTVRALGPKMQEIAASRVIAPAAAAAPAMAAPAAVAAGGAGLTAYATNLLSKLSPEQRQQLMGDVGSDTGFAAAIMNRGQ